MSTRRRYPRTRRAELAELNNWQVFALEFEQAEDLAGWEGDLDAQAEAWRLHGGYILAGWIARHPGTRPHGWWRFEHGVWPKPSAAQSFSGEAAYLDRRGLLTDAEREALHPREVAAPKSSAHVNGFHA